MGLKERESKRTSTIAAISGLDAENNKTGKAKKKPSDERQPRLYYLDQDLIRAIDYRAFKDQQEKSAIVREALEKYLEKELTELRDRGDI